MNEPDLDREWQYYEASLVGRLDHLRVKVQLLVEELVEEGLAATRWLRG